MIEKHVGEVNPQPGSFVMAYGKWYMVRDIRDGLVWVEHKGKESPMKYEDIEMDDSKVGIA
tara:strand:- start:542 stop:724 length:183 start_codon:yes stop_codon:yes gene_type:complete